MSSAPTPSESSSRADVPFKGASQVYPELMANRVQLFIDNPGASGPLVTAAVLFDYDCLRDHRVRPLGFLNDSKQCTPERREALFDAILAAAEQVVVRVIPHGEIDRNGLHRSNLAAMRQILHALSPPAEACLVDGFRLGPTAPEHRAVVDGDERGMHRGTARPADEDALGPADADDAGPAEIREAGLPLLGPALRRSEQ